MLSYHDELASRYRAVRARLFSRDQPAEVPRIRRVPIRPQPHRPDVAPAGAPKTTLLPVAKTRRPRDFIRVMQIASNDRGNCPDWLWRPILHEVLEKHRVREQDILRDIRPAPVVRARQELFYRMRTELSVSFEMIGKVVGDRDHTTVRHGYLRHKARLEAMDQ